MRRPAPLITVKIKRTPTKLEKKARRGHRGYPVATVAFYGPDASRATKVAVGIIAAEGAEASDLRTWSSETSDVRRDARMTVQQHFTRNKHSFVDPDPAYAFLMMAITPADPFLDDVYAAVERACATAGQRVERVDRAVFTGEITEKILSSTELAGTVIADLTHERLNVYYEIGFAHGRGKQVILTTPEGTRAHFDLQSQKILFYRSATDLELRLTSILAELRIK